MTTLVLLIALAATAPTATQPVTTLLNIDCADQGAVERVHTALAVLPTVSLATVGSFPDAEKKSVAATLKTLGRFPTKLGLALIRKQLRRRNITTAVVLSQKSIYVVTTGLLRGPWAIPGPRAALSVDLVEFLSSPFPKKSRTRAVATAQVPWWKNWIFWTGVVVITGSIVAFSLLTQDPDSVDVHVRYPAK